MSILKMFRTWTTTHSFSLTFYSSLHRFFMSLSSSVSIALFFDIKCHYAVGDHWRDITVGIKISGGISSGCMWYNREKYEGFYIIHFLMLSTNKLCTTGIPWKPDLNFLHILPIDRQTDSINMFYVMYAESMVFIHVVTVLLAGATLFMALDVVKDFGKAEKTFFLPDPHIRLYIVWSRNHYATTSPQPYLLESPVG